MNPHNPGGRDRSSPSSAGDAEGTPLSGRRQRKPYSVEGPLLGWSVGPSPRAARAGPHIPGHGRDGFLQRCVGYRAPTVYWQSRTGCVGSGGALSRGRRVPLSAPAEAAAAGFLTAGRGISGVRRRSRSASSHRLFPTLLTHQLGRVTFGGFSSSSEQGLCHLSVRMLREGI